MRKNQSILTEEARNAIRSYLFKLVIPSGIALGIIASIITFLIKDIATGESTG